jgi:hypothetical protein
VDRNSNKVTGDITLFGLLQGRNRSVIREQERLRLFG